MRLLPALPFLLLALAPALAACDGGGDPVQQALREAAAKNHSDATRTTAEVEGAQRATADEAYVAGMTALHKGGIAMAEAALRDSRDPEIRRMAQAAIDARTREIAAMRAWKPAAE